MIFQPCISMPLFMSDPSKPKYRKRPQISKPTGLLVNCPESVLKVKEISTQNCGTICMLLDLI